MCLLLLLLTMFTTSEAGWWMGCLGWDGDGKVMVQCPAVMLLGRCRGNRRDRLAWASGELG